MANPELNLYMAGWAQVEWGVLSKQQGGWLVHYIGQVGTCSCHSRAAAAPGDGKSGTGNEYDGWDTSIEWGLYVPAVRA